MIPAKIISIDDKVMVKYGDTIAEVENVNRGKTTRRWFAEIKGKIWLIWLCKEVFIEPTGNNKVKIMKI